MGAVNLVNGHKIRAEQSFDALLLIVTVKKVARLLDKNNLYLTQYSPIETLPNKWRASRLEAVFYLFFRGSEQESIASGVAQIESPFRLSELFFFHIRSCF